MADNELALWWSSLSVAQKERIAKKGLTKAAAGKPVEEADFLYPACSRWWNTLDEDLRWKIHDHCTKDHGYLMAEWKEADPYGD